MSERICVVIGRTRHKMVMAELQEAVNRGARLIELRLDFLAKSVDFKRIRESKGCPLVATVRRAADGGRWPGKEDERLTLIRQAIVSDVFDWVDIETDIADSVRRFGKVKRIVSYHNTQETPENLDEIYAKMCEQDADVVKIAVAAQRASDQLRVLKILREQKKPTVGHCMGEFGFASRFLALKYGAPFIYAAFNKERGIAPGLPSFEEGVKTYHADRINAETKVFGVVGDPVMHSLSPILHNQLFREHNLNAIYLPFRVARGDFPSFLKGFEVVPVSGYSVTIPHKEAAAAVAVESDDSVKSYHAANTLVRGDKGFFAANTDAKAALESLQYALPPENGQPATLAGKRVMILGAGGAARAIAHILRQMGCQLTLVSRTLAKAEQIASEVEGKAIEWATRHNGECDILINATPIGMHPNVDDSPIHSSYLKPDMVVFDTVYTPENTLLLKQARERECIVVSGIEMFVRQAAAQFELFTGIQTDLTELRETMRRIISPLTYRDDEEDA